MSETSFPGPAESYERFYGPAIFAPAAEILLESADPRPRESVLDLACGTGRVARRVAPRVGEGGARGGDGPEPRDVGGRGCSPRAAGGAHRAATGGRRCGMSIGCSDPGGGPPSPFGRGWTGTPRTRSWAPSWTRPASWGLRIEERSIQARFPDPPTFLRNMELAYAAVIPGFVENPNAFEVFVTAVEEDGAELVRRHMEDGMVMLAMHMWLAVEWVKG